MKKTPRIAYFYASSPDIAYPEMPAIPPDGAILCIESDTFPKEVPITLNVAIVNITKGNPYSFHIKVLLDDMEISKGNTQASPIRYRTYLSGEGEFAVRHSFLETYTLDKPGSYTFVINLYDKYLTEPPVSDDGLVHRAECSIAIAKSWR
ncbi:hypothetical protein [Raoultella planticola]|uniref:hypothetical protein n=1 Tax=Raoultella planticola TaxID=575 RepID=UPI001F52F5BE|nr:hypothetical protein [Raoultella planticola]UNK75799.1 hypothetical protein MNO12_04260 [Raoultella planticola]